MKNAKLGLVGAAIVGLGLSFGLCACEEKKPTPTPAAPSKPAEPAKPAAPAPAPDKK